MEAAMLGDVPQEDEWTADDAYALDDFAEEEAEAVDEDADMLSDSFVAALGSDGDTPVLRWTVSDPTAACLRIQSALRQAGADPGFMMIDSAQVTLRLTVNPDGWPALMEALEAEGYQPTEEDAGRETTVPMTVTLYLEKEEP